MASRMLLQRGGISSCLPRSLAPTLGSAPASTTIYTPSQPLNPISQYRTKSTTTPSPTSTQNLINLTQSRRTIYNLGKSLPPNIADTDIESLVHHAAQHVPSAFNTQSTRLVLLLHAEHERLWGDVAVRTLEEKLVKTGMVSREVWEGQTVRKLEGFRGGVGTVLFYEDPAHIKPFQEKFPPFKDHFGTWAEHTNAMHQYFLWTGLESLGFGANLQHYNPVIDESVAKQWDIPQDWRLVAQLVFGSPEGGPNEKSQKPIEEKVKVFGKRN